MKAVLNGTVVAEADKDDLIYIEQNWYFPPASVHTDLLQKSDTPYTCPWKGECQYWDVQGGNGEWSKDAGFSYPEPVPSAIERVHKDFSGYVAFWRDVEITE